MRKIISTLSISSSIFLFSQEQKNDSVNTMVENELKEVDIKVRKKLIERKVDRLVFNVQNSVAATGGNALDALKITPRIKVLNDQISMIGKSSMLVMINERPIQLSGNELINYLKTLNVEDLKRIEIISNPPAKYNAEGNSGIINIVTKDIKNEAWNASFRNVYQQATFATGNTGGSFNLQKGKIELNTNLNYMNGSNSPNGKSEINYPFSMWNIENNWRNYVNSLTTRFGLIYKINKKFKSGFNINHIKSNPLIKDNEVTRIFNTKTNFLDSTLITKGRNEYKTILNSLNYFFVYKVDTLGRNLSLDIDYFNYKNTKNRIFKSQSFSNNNINTLLEARNFGIQQINNYSINLDFEHPTNWLDFNYGGRISQINTNNLFSFFDVTNENEILDLTQSNVFEYKEKNSAIFFSTQKNFNDKWETKFGLRYEWTQTEGISQTINEVNRNNYQKLFPTFYISYTPNKNNSFNFNYGKRIKRPTYNFLNPFRFVSNPFSFTEGNPFLKPAFTDNIEFEYAYKDNFITSIYFSYTDDNFEQVTLLDSTNNIQRTLPLNFIINQTFGINQTFILKLKKWFNLNVSLDIYHSSTNSKVSQTMQFLKGWNGEFNISNDFIVNHSKTLLLNIDYNYTTKGVSNLDYNSSTNQLDMSIKYLLLNKNLIISLNFNDILRSNRFIYETFTNRIKNSFSNYYDERFLRVGIIYNLGKKFNTTNRDYRNQEDLERTNKI